MKCLVVTGGCGFIGSNFIRDQIARYPEQAIVNIDKLTYAGNPENLADIEGNPRYEFKQEDICDREFVRGVLQCAKARRAWSISPPKGTWIAAFSIPAPSSRPTSSAPGPMDCFP